MTTPEQHAKWRVKFESRYDLAQLGTVYERYLNSDVREAWGNYVEAREDASQETEQAIKDARKQALEDALDLFPQGFAMLSTNQVREIIEGLLK